MGWEEYTLSLSAMACISRRSSAVSPSRRSGSGSGVRSIIRSCFSASVWVLVIDVSERDCE